MMIAVKDSAKIFAALCLSLFLMPASSFAQGQGGQRGGGQWMQTLQEMQQVLPKLDLTDDQKTKIKGITEKGMSDARDMAQDLRNATPDERQQKMQDLQKLISDTQTKVIAQLTPEQKAKFYPLWASTSMENAGKMLTAIKTAVGKMDLNDDQKKQMNDLVDQTTKSLDGMKSAADGVKDEQSSKDFDEQLGQVQQDTRRQIVQILGQDDARQLMQQVRQAMRPAGGGGGRNRNGANGENTPTTKPAAQ